MAVVSCKGWFHTGTTTLQQHRVRGVWAAQPAAESLSCSAGPADSALVSSQTMPGTCTCMVQGPVCFSALALRDECSLLGADDCLIPISIHAHVCNGLRWPQYGRKGVGLRRPKWGTLCSWSCVTGLGGHTIVTLTRPGHGQCSVLCRLSLRCHLCITLCAATLRHALPTAVAALYVAYSYSSPNIPCCWLCAASYPMYGFHWQHVAHGMGSGATVSVTGGAQG
jgi:hypothetical protein